MADIDWVRQRLGEGLVIPACPLALNARRNLDERHQRGLFRYYLDAGAGGLAVGVHTTQFAIRQKGLFRPILELASDELWRKHPEKPPKHKGESIERAAPSAVNVGLKRPVGIGGIVGPTKQATAEAGLIRELGFSAGLLSLGALGSASEAELLAHCREVANIIPVVGFYLQPAAGGRLLSFSFWRKFAEIQQVVAIKIAAFNRYQTIDVVRALAEAGREDVALYTGNDDNIVMDLLTPYRFRVGVRVVEKHFVGGLLGHWAVWTHRAVELHQRCRRIVQLGEPIPVEMMRRSVEVTDANAAFFDAANGFAGCIPGIHEILRRAGLLAGAWCLDEHERLSPGQLDEIDRVCLAYPHLNDDAFVAELKATWLQPASVKGHG